MIELDRSEQSEPYVKFYSLYDQCIKKNQNLPQVIALSSYDKLSEQSDVRYVNLKYIHGEEWIFFTNYNSLKAKHFETNNKISGAIYWDKIDIQIRIKGIIKRKNESFSDIHFSKRDKAKNALAISSYQSQSIISYEKIIENFQKVLAQNEKSLKKRPNYWGGYSLTPYFIELWQGHSSRINKREVFEKIDGIWNKSFLQP